MPDYLSFPVVDPVLVQIGPLAIRWYALAYIAGLVLGWRYVVWLANTAPLWATKNIGGLPRPYWAHRHLDEGARKSFGVKPPATGLDIDDFLVWATLGVIIGGRLGFVFLYAVWFDSHRDVALGFSDLSVFGLFSIPFPNALAVWQGGMAFHGGLIGVIIALVLYTRRRGLDIFRMGDLLAMAAPIGLFFGRIANFINQELWGRVTDGPLGMVFPREVIELCAQGIRVVPMPPEVRIPPEIAVRCQNGATQALETVIRHPSQLYEALAEGLILFVVLAVLVFRKRILDRPGLTAGLFVVGYGIGRASVEFFREASAPLWDGSGLTFGMLYSIPMWAGGAWLIWRAFKNPPVVETMPAPPLASEAAATQTARKGESPQT